MFVEGEHHSVWQNDKGELIDVVPRPHGGRRVLFLPEPLRVFNGLRTPNVRRQISQAEEVWYFLKISKDIEELMGPEVGPYPVTRKLYEQEILRGHFQLKMREMTRAHWSRRPGRMHGGRSKRGSAFRKRRAMPTP
jgi:hypothetical protein